MENSTIDKDRAILKLVKTLIKARSIMREIGGIDCIYMRKEYINVDVTSELGMNSKLTFVAGEREYNKDDAICDFGNDVQVKFKIPAKVQPQITVVEDAKDDVIIPSETSSVAA